MKIHKVGVLGGGTMGSGIAEVCARARLDTLVVEVDASAVEAAENRMTSSLERSLVRGRLSEDEHAEAVSNLSYSTDLADFADRDLVIEAIIEDLPEKLRNFAALDEVLAPQALLASNTSSISIGSLAAATRREGQVIGMHFFNPRTVQPLVEIVRSLPSEEAVCAAAADFCVNTLGKQVIHCADRAGFVVNRLLVPYLLSAIALADTGWTTKEDIDAGMKGGCAHPMGPLELCDLIGLDTIEAVADVMYEEFKEPLYAPPPLLRRMVAAGRLGRKSGRGFYTYD